ncbi:hypothetical protein CQ14_39080 [Bradyrhizobium lablabi]|uniref:Uncharacterized protein n=1 Tax=Bradyrhizobium lablabi TaxID=722472 RepID=A0A0R3MVZ1_9BRAD|nr:hypothetical protein CQ14_39080 [Bradyrhizobium lablabi]
MRIDSRGSQCDLGLRLISDGAAFSGAWVAVAFSSGALMACTALEVAAAATGGDTDAVKATGLATGGRGCAAAATGVSTGLLWRPTV